MSPQDQRNFEALVECLSNAGRPVLGVCGAGMSFPVGYPSWSRLIRQLFQHLENNSRIKEVNEDIRRAIEAGVADPPLLAEWARSRLDRDTFYGFIRDVFRPKATIDYSDEHDLLVRLPIRLWMTTNYDACLSEALSAYLQQNVSTVNKIPFSELNSKSTTLPVVVHLHGSWSEPDSIVLTATDYKRVYHQSPYLERALHGLAPLTLLFIGYGLKDPDFMYHLRSTHAVLDSGSSPHFAIVPRHPGESDFQLEMQSSQLRDCGVRTIFYPVEDDDHGMRKDMLNKLAIALHAQVPPVPQTLQLYWSQPNTTEPELRRQLHSLAQAADPRARLRLCACSFTTRFVKLSLSGAATVASLREAARPSPFWSDKPTSGPSVLESTNLPATSTLTTRAGTPMVTQQPVLPSSSVVNRTELGCVKSQSSKTPAPTQKHTAEESCRFAMHALALGILDPKCHHAAAVIPSLFPEALPFGLADCFQSVLDWRLDSPVVHAFFYTRDSSSEGQLESGIVAITLVGIGVPEVRRVLEPAVYAAGLALGDQPSHIVTRGFVHLTRHNDENQEKKPLGLVKQLGLLLHRGTNAAPPTLTDDPNEMLNGLAAIVRRLARETGFVEVHDCPHRRLLDLTSQLRRETLTKRTETPALITPDGHPRVLLHFPFPILNSRKPKLLLKISSDVTKTPEFEVLSDLLYRSIFTRLFADLERRIEFFKSEIDRDRHSVEWFGSLPEEQQAKMPPVITSRQIVWALALDVATERHEVAAKVYYLHSLPEIIIPREQSELQRLIALREPLEALRKSNPSALTQWCVERLIDCALRDVLPSDDIEINRLFDLWRRSIFGMLAIEWRRVLEQQQIAASDIFKRTTVFSVRRDPEKNLFEIVPHSLIDSRRASVLIDSKRNSIVVFDPLDDAYAVPVTDQHSELTGATIRKILDSGDPLETKIASLRSAALSNLDLARKICGSVTESSWNPSGLSALHRQVIDKARESTAGVLYDRLLGYYCLNSANEVLDSLPQAQAGAARALCLAIRGCTRRGLDPLPVLRAFASGSSIEIPEEVRADFSRALLANRQLVEHFLAFQSFDRDVAPLTASEKILWRIEHVLEAVRIASEFSKAADKLNPAGESVSAAFFKCEFPFWLSHSATFTEPPPVLRWIQRILSGEPMTSDEIE